MKKNLLRLVIIAGMIIMTIYSGNIQADPPGPPGPGGAPSGNNKVGDNQISAPIGDGAGILFCLALTYGGYKVYKSLKDASRRKRLKHGDENQGILFSGSGFKIGE